MKHALIRWIAFFTLGIASSVDAATATWNRNPESSVVGYRLSYGTQSGVHPTSINVGNVVSYQFFPPSGQRYYVVVQAYTSTGALSPKSAEVILDLTGSGSQNQPPVLTQPANQSSVQNTAASLTLVASDPQGTPVSYAVSGLPPGLSVNASTGVISGTVTTAGSYPVTATASDGSLSASRSFTWTVTATTSSTITVNLSPLDTTIDNKAQNLGGNTQLIAHTYPANRVLKAIVMKFDLSQIPSNAQIQAATLQLYLVGMDSAATDPNYAVSLHRIVNVNANPSQATGFVASSGRSWTANSCCAGGVPLAQADITAAQAVTSINRTVGAKTWNALSLVQSWRSSPATNYGLLLNADKTKNDRFRTFASVEDGTATRRPFLRITYTLPAGSTTDTTAPTVALTSPGAGAYVSGTSVTVSASASDAVGVVGVQFKRDGVNIGAEDVTAPYAITWNTTSTTNGGHQLTAVARDAAGNTTTSSARTVNVSNTSSTSAATLTQSADVTSTGSADEATAEGAAALLAAAAAAPIESSDSSDTPVEGDFDGDGRPDPATYRRSTGEWRVWRSSSNYAVATPIVWGVATDSPVPADYDGDRRTDIAVYRPSTGTWHILLSSANMQSSLEIQWGDEVDRPLPVDYDRDGRADLALPRSGGFEILLSRSNYKNSVTVR
jgi:hypothetical protein